LFGLIVLGFAASKLKPIPDAGLAWMNFSSSSTQCCRRRSIASRPRRRFGTFVAVVTLTTVMGLVKTLHVVSLMPSGRGVI
jgi:hypothetical protein